MSTRGPSATKVWDCSLQCYDKRLLSTGGAAAFGAQAWVSGQIFATAVNAVVAKDGPNGLTRAALLDAVRGLTNFDDNGFIAPTNIGGKVASKCLIGMQVQNGKFVRVDPVEPGKSDCTGGVITISLDPVKAYKG